MNSSKFSGSSPFAVAQDLFFRLMSRRLDLHDAEPVVVEIYALGAHSNANDFDVSGVYLMEVDDTVPAHKIADAALDAFHSAVPISATQDFGFVVTRHNEVLAQDPNHIDGTFRHKAVFVSKVLG